MKTQSIQSGIPIIQGDVTITPVCRISASVYSTAGSLLASGSIVPLGILIHSPHEDYALSISGERITAEAIFAKSGGKGN